MGLGFWTKLDPTGQPAAITFPSIEVAQSYTATWDGGIPEEISFAEVIPDDGDFASIAACVRAGLEGWVVECIPAANALAI